MCRRWLFSLHTWNTWFHCLAVFMGTLGESVVAPLSVPLPEPSCLPSCSEWFSCFSPGQNFPLPYPTRDTPGLACVFRCFPQVRKTRSSFKGHLLQSILSLYKTLTKCILGDFLFCFPHLWPVFHSFFCLYIFHFPFLLSNSGYFLQVVLQLINYLLGHLPFINFTFQP